MSIRSFRSCPSNSLQQVAHFAFFGFETAARLENLDSGVFELADFLREVGRRSEALEQVAKALGDEPAFLLARLFRAQILLEAGETEKARGEWRVASQLHHDLASVSPESPYATDLLRWPTQLAGALRERLQSP